MTAIKRKLARITRYYRSQGYTGRHLRQAVHNYYRNMYS